MGRKEGGEGKGVTIVIASRVTSTSALLGLTQAQTFQSAWRETRPVLAISDGQFLPF